MRKGLWLLCAMLFALVLLSACGQKSQEAVTKGLREKVGELKGYKVTALMTLKVGNEPQSYDIDVWHNKPGDYRVHLKNAKKEQSQMILRNKSGVYVLTPALNKSYRFQSEWPQNSSQAYLYESLVKDVLEDKEAKFNTTKDHYVFETKTRYKNNQMLPKQIITFKKKSLEPVSVKVMDTNEEAVVTVQFSNVEFNAKFDKDSFDTKKNMTTAQLTVPVIATNSNKEFAVRSVLAEIPGVTMQEEVTAITSNGKRVLQTYAGPKSFTLIQEKASAIPASSMSMQEVNGEMVDLGFSIGAMTANSISWTEDGVDYLLASHDLSPEEMVWVAQSVQGASIK